ncbi:uncharacterized protein [Aegilops tauschii subsp. strangulata]|uniref:uncharacterized protein n=1 Tax=Aegilops tauschii subsp. strangulata TaxID=200361 RepID=UPI00098A419C|nr:uncharacterized protein LOC109785952 [Aegilops tauschii subsp. strangulata]
MMMLCMPFRRYMCGSQIGSYLSARIFKYTAFGPCAHVCYLEFLDFQEDHNIFKGANKVCSTVGYWSSTKCFECSFSHEGMYKMFMCTVIMPTIS